MKYKHPFKKEVSYGQTIKAMASICGQDIFKDVKLPQKRATETKPRQVYRSDEAKLRKEMIKFLRKKGCHVYRIENGLCGYKGVPDLILFAPNKKLFSFIELKSPIGKLSEEQEEFRLLCKTTEVMHIIARSLEDVRCLYETP